MCQAALISSLRFALSPSYGHEASSPPTTLASRDASRAGEASTIVYSAHRKLEGRLGLLVEILSSESGYILKNADAVASTRVDVHASIFDP